MVYDKTRFINYVYKLTKQQKLKIGELETACGVSVGYFARLRQGEKILRPQRGFAGETGKWLYC